VDKLETLKEELKAYIELLKLVSIFLLTVAGGTVGLFFKLKNPIAIPFIFFGIVLTIGFAVLVIQLLGTIGKLLKELRNEQ